MSLSAESQAALDGPPHSFILDNEVYEVLPDEWWPALRTIRLENHWAFSFLLGVAQEDDGIALAERLVDESDPLDQDDLVPVAEQLVQLATGRVWYVAARLAVVVDSNWSSIDGRLLQHGVNLLPMLKSDPSRALNIVHTMLYENASDKRSHELDNELQRPPRAAMKTRRSTAEDAALFESAFSSAGSL